MSLQRFLDEFSRGVVDEDEDAEAAPTDRTYWEKKGTKSTVALADHILEMLRDFDPTLKLKYNKFYIGLEKNGQPFNFVHFVPKKKYMQFGLKLPQSAQFDAMIEAAGLETLEYNKQSGRYRIRLTEGDISAKSHKLKELSQSARDLRAGV